MQAAFVPKCATLGGEMADALRMRLEAAEGLLREVRGSAAHARVSRAQSDLVMNLLSSTTLVADDLGSTAELIGRCSWASPQEKQGLLAALGHAVQVVRVATRAKQQNFELLGCYLLVSQWELLLNADVEYNVKLRALADHALQLGLRNPSETSVARITALLMLCVEGSARARCLAPAYLRDVFLHVKGMLKPRTAPAPLEAVPELMADVAEFQAKHPRTFAAVFAAGGPATCKLQYSEILAVSQGIQMRDRKGASSSGTSANSSLQGNPLQHAMKDAIAQLVQNMLAGGSMQVGNGATIQLTGGTPRRLRPALEAAANFCNGPGDAIEHEPPREALPQRPTLQPAIPSHPQGAPQLGSQADVLPSKGEPEASEGAPPKRAKKTVEDATASILLAMGKKSEAKAAGKLLKKPAAATQASDTFSQKPPCFSVEHSRSQVLYRTGLAGAGQSKTIRFHDEASMEKAISQAKKMVAEESRKRGC